MATGQMPTARHDGSPWGEGIGTDRKASDHRRKKQAQSSIGVKGVLAEIRGSRRGSIWPSLFVAYGYSHERPPCEETCVQEGGVCVARTTLLATVRVAIEATGSSIRKLSDSRSTTRSRAVAGGVGARQRRSAMCRRQRHGGNLLGD